MLHDALSVEELNEYVRKVLSTDPILSRLKIYGEISNFKRHSSGHWYFTLKGEKSRISCVMFRQYTYSVKKIPEDGMQLTLEGNVNIYVRDGVYQFYALSMEEKGQGDLYLKFEKLKAKLEKEGLFDLKRKREIPLLPNKIGIVTSMTGAVLHDIYQVATRRFPEIPMVLFPVAVQGEEAAQQIAKGIEYISTWEGVDIIIVGRGGGSIEDLWPFNEEIVARAIYKSKIPVVSAVGHETDFTIADFVADVRAATPSMAAELAVPIKNDLFLTIENNMNTLSNIIEKKIMSLDQKYMELLIRLEEENPNIHISNYKNKLEKLQQKIQSNIEQFFLKREGVLKAHEEKLKALNPFSVLKRGYSIIEKEGKNINSIKEIAIEDEFSLLVADGTIKAKTIDKKAQKHNLRSVKNGEKNRDKKLRN